MQMNRMHEFPSRVTSTDSRSFRVLLEKRKFLIETGPERERERERNRLSNTRVPVPRTEVLTFSIESPPTIAKLPRNFSVQTLFTLFRIDLC